jgi:hypothetical protein
LSAAPIGTAAAIITTFLAFNQHPGTELTDVFAHRLSVARKNITQLPLAQE